MLDNQYCGLLVVLFSSQGAQEPPNYLLVPSPDLASTLWKRLFFFVGRLFEIFMFSIKSDF